MASKAHIKFNCILHDGNPPEFFDRVYAPIRGDVASLKRLVCQVMGIQLQHLLIWKVSILSKSFPKLQLTDLEN